ncbi:hypothetical protein EDB86DRAFT_2953849 [Lactarius hatsudake]|nr:hypothetical protein EDB86DRAFT_2953849 [Lactarius hatsudake]
MSIRLLTLHLSLSQRPLAEVAAVVAVNTHIAHMVVVWSALPARAMWNGCFNMWSSLATLWGRGHGAARYAPRQIV